MRTKHFVNLTNGIEVIPKLDGEYSFIRIQSTACEQKRWDFILQDLDYTFLMSLALGHKCIVYDYGANKPTPRAIHQGLEFVRYVLSRRWFGEILTPFVRGHNVSQYFNGVYRSLSDQTLKKLDYFRKFLRTDQLNLEIITGSTSRDGDYDYYRDILFEKEMTA
ncbi:hypothetical protein [Paenibacillus dendritiformis]|uniref:hypothetical protein n=1 Tax=Paenibacillus dendritiformis TaxID=130049 RepID=UPI00387E0B87